MKKIIYIYSNLPKYRRDFFIGLNQQLLEEGVTLKVMYGTLTDSKEVSQDAGGEYEKFPFLSKTHNLGVVKLVTMEGLFKKLEKIAPDAIVISYVSTNLTMLHIVRYCLSKHISYATWRCGYNRDDYSSLSSKIRTLLINYVERNADYNIAYGSWYKKELIKKGIPSKQIVIAQNTINTDRILERNKTYNRSYRHSTTRVLFVGALIERKYLPSSIDAIAILRGKGYNIEFDIIGGGTILNDLKSYVLSIGLNSYVHIYGPKYGDEIAHFFRMGDIFLAAGLGGLAINEAMAYGLPIISTNADGTICDLIDGNGYLMDRFNDAELQAKYLEEFIQKSPEEKIHMSKRSEEIISTKASLANMVEKHRQVCLKFLNK